MSIIIDPEFKALIPPLTSDEYTQLEKNILKDGIRDALIVWPQPDGNDILIDGHNRFDISAAHAGIRFNIIRKEFDSRDAAIAWIAGNQLGRRNLHPLDREKLMSVRRGALERQAKKNQAVYYGNQYEKVGLKEKLPEVQNLQTRDIIGKEIGVSGRQVDKLHTINEKATERTKQLVREGKLSVNQAYNSVRPKRPDPVKQAKEEHADFTKKKKTGVVDIADARLDKINREIINNALMEEFHKMLDAVDKFGLLHSRDDIRQLAQAVSKDALGATIERCTATGKTLMLMLEIMEDIYERN